MHICLSDGSNPLEGKLEICHNHAWGAVCDTGFSQNDAHSYSIPLRDAAFGEGLDIIDKRACGENETMISDCDRLVVTM